MTNHLNQPEKILLWQYFFKALIYNSFRLLKYNFLLFFTSFSLYFQFTTIYLCNKKTLKPLYYLRFGVLAFPSVKTENPLILYIFISLTYLKINFSILLFFSFFDNYFIKKMTHRNVALCIIESYIPFNSKSLYST